MTEEVDIEYPPTGLIVEMTLVGCDPEDEPENQRISWNSTGEDLIREVTQWVEERPEVYWKIVGYHS